MKMKMDLIPLPQEEKNSQTPTRKNSLIENLRRKLKLKEISCDEKLVGNTCLKLIRYVNEGEKFSMEEIKNLLHGMERSTISIQKKKKNFIEKRRKKG